jgi:RNA polymerase sigma factor (sigma-70 family)
MAKKDMQNSSRHEGESREEVADLLMRLSSADAGPAWSEFLDRYSSLIMKTVSRFEYRQSRTNECFLYVCEQLNDDHFRRLVKYNTRGKARFRTWLGAVVFNLCIDWHRREFGRVTLLPVISALPAFDQAVYRLVIEQEMSKEAAFQTLKADFPDLSRELLCKSVSRVHSILTPRQRWQISVRKKRRQPASVQSPRPLLNQICDPNPGPEVLLQKNTELEELKNAISMLPHEQRLLLHLRFQEGLSLKKIADLADLGDSNRAWRHLQAALKALFRQLQKKIITRKN